MREESKVHIKKKRDNVVSLGNWFSNVSSCGMIARQSIGTEVGIQQKLNLHSFILNNV